MYTGGQWATAVSSAQVSYVGRHNGLLHFTQSQTHCLTAKCSSFVGKSLLEVISDLCHSHSVVLPPTHPNTLFPEQSTTPSPINAQFFQQCGLLALSQAYLPGLHAHLLGSLDLVCHCVPTTYL